ncbi:terpene synthase family protein [Actinomadura sp. WAC 06369]|uniref:terpene synthase family protein n=1 Tax=Actinomadura sp. WAC 06369 TaxID=2203193 RepID=UPI000F784147|nr:terpene synthase family protein [Actinomadura sp. WAC 06369]
MEITVRGRPLGADLARDAARLAPEVERDLSARMAAHPELFPASPMGPVAGRLSKAIAYGAPWHTADELRTSARTSLWIFAVDWLVDHRATEAAEVAGIVERCAAVADGRPPVDPLTRFLAELRDDLAASSLAFAEYEPVWREELLRMLQAMRREWQWKARLGAGGAPPAAADDGDPVPTTLDGYLAIADNFGSAWVNAAHWIATGDAAVFAHLDVLRRAGRVVQCALRLLNDLATGDRETVWNDINAVALGVPAEAVKARIGDLADETERILAPLRRDCPQGANYLSQQFQWSRDFYGRGHDYWGSL